MAKKGKKSKMVHISKLHKNHPYVKAVRTRTTAGYRCSSNNFIGNHRCHYLGFCH